MSVALDGQRDVPADEGERRVRTQRARQQAGLGQDLEAVADPEHEPAATRRTRSRPASPARSVRSRRSGGSRRTRSRLAGRPPTSLGAAPPRCARCAARRRRGPSAPAARRDRRSSRGRRPPAITGRGSRCPSRAHRCAVELDLVALDQRDSSSSCSHMRFELRDARRRGRRSAGRRRPAGRRAPRRPRSRGGAASSRRPVPAGRGCPASGGRARSPSSRSTTLWVGEVVVECDARSAARTPRRSGRACR